VPLSFISYSARGLRREKNEDALLVDDKRGLFAVADGLGGHLAGEVASTEVIAHLEQVQFDPHQAYPDLLGQLIHGANTVLLEKAAQNAAFAGMGTTLCLLYLGGDGHCSIANAGDSRAYHFRKNKIEQITADHTLAEELRKAGQLPKNFSPEHQSNHILTSALGMREQTEFDIFDLPYEPNDIVLLCTDGVTKHLADKELTLFCQQHSDDLPALRDAIMAAVNSRGATDNFTFIILRFT
jgi:serine/threonine protein phosphatase PrpC